MFNFICLIHKLCINLQSVIYNNNKAMKKIGENKLTVDEIRPRLKSGDHLLIAEIVGCSADYVRMVMYKLRKSEKVLAIANEVIENRIALVKRLKEFNYKG